MRADGGSQSGFAAVVAGGAVLLAGLALARLLYADPLGADPLDGAAPLVDAFLAGCGGLYTAAAEGAARLRLPLTLALLAALGVSLGARRALVGWARLGAALGLGWMAQSFLAEGRWAVGAGLYAALGVGYWLRAPQPPAPGRPLPRRIEIPATLSLLALFVVLGMHRLDVYPPFYYDEGAYLTAARMQAGELEPGPVRVTESIVAPRYGFERFRAQIVPLWAQAAAVRELSPSLLGLRALSLAAALATLVVAALAVRRHLGPRVALWMLALSSVSPLFLAYARTAFYLSFSPLHAALAFACVLRLAERWDRSSAVLTGLVLGSSIYFYQVSWFVPGIAVAALLAGRGLGPWRSAPGVPLLVAALAGVSLLPAMLGLRSGFGEVLHQTFDRRAAWSGQGYASAELARAWEASPHAPQTWMAPFMTFWRQGDRLVLRVSAPQHDLETLLPRLEEAGWELEGRGAVLPSVVRNLADMTSLLFFAPGIDQMGRWVREPLLTHLLAPLAVLGVLEALRRRREPAWRMLLVIAIATALLPGALGLALPRRAVLLVPFLYALGALPLLEASARSRAGVRVAGTILVFGAALGAGSHAYFGRWYAPPREDAPTPALLDYRKLLHGLPDAEPVLLTKPIGRLERLRERLEGAPPGRRAPTLFQGPLTPERVWLASCGTRPPFVWIGAGSDEDRELLQRVEQGFAPRVEVRDGLRALHVSRRARGCEPGDPGTPGALSPRP